MVVCSFCPPSTAFSVFGRPRSKDNIPRGTSPWALRKSASLLVHSPGRWIWLDLTSRLVRPLNPVLGELFYGHWPDQGGRGRTTLVVEQVSHHPPITAYVIENKSKGLTLTGHNAQKTSFSSGAIIVKQIGHAILTIDLGGGKKEEVLITLPKLRIDGLWYGSPYIELWDKTNIQSSSGWSSVVSSLSPSSRSWPHIIRVRQLEYKGKGYFSGKIHTIKATVSPPGSFGIKHTIEGQWHIQTRDTKSGKVFTDVTSPKEEVTVGPTEQMEEFESRKLWGLVSQGIREGDYETAAREKSKIEVGGWPESPVWYTHLAS